MARFRRSAFAAAMNALSRTLPNLGMAMEARMPMITTTMRSSRSEKPRSFRRGNLLFLVLVVLIFIFHHHS